MEAASLSLEHSPTRSRSQGGTSKRKWPYPNFDELNDRFLSREEAALYLGLTVEALARDVVNGRLGVPYHKFGQLSRYRRSELDEWAEAQRRRGMP
jgi:excisionase family DNA binding protein